MDPPRPHLRGEVGGRGAGRQQDGPVQGQRQQLRPGATARGVGQDDQFGGRHGQHQFVVPDVAQVEADPRVGRGGPAHAAGEVGVGGRAEDVQARLAGDSGERGEQCLDALVRPQQTGVDEAAGHRRRPRGVAVVRR